MLQKVIFLTQLSGQKEVLQKISNTQQRSLNDQLLSKSKFFVCRSVALNKQAAAFVGAVMQDCSIREQLLTLPSIQGSMRVQCARTRCEARTALQEAKSFFNHCRQDSFRD